jgi:hypothetical protein
MMHEGRGELPAEKLDDPYPSGKQTVDQKKLALDFLMIMKRAVEEEIKSWQRAPDWQVEAPDKLPSCRPIESPTKVTHLSYLT